MTRDAANLDSAGFERRRHHRVPVARSIRLQIAGRDEVLAMTANVSSGGLFVECPEPPPVGSRVKFVLDLGKRAIRGYAEVAWIRLRHESSAVPRGMGLRILFVLDDSARHFADFIAEVEDGTAD